MALSSAVQAALAQLSGATTLQQVTDIANSLSVAATTPNGVLYSGMIGEVESNAAAQSFATATGASIINNTDRAQFLALLDPTGESAYNKVLTTILQNTGNLTPAGALQEAQIALFGSVLGTATTPANLTSSLWGQASAEFASSLSGKVTVIGSAASSAGIFAQVEIPAVLANAKVTSFAGQTLASLQSLYTAGGLADVLPPLQAQFTTILADGGVLFKGNVVAFSQEALEALGQPAGSALTASALEAAGYAVLSGAASAAESALGIAGSTALGFLGTAVGGAIINIFTSATPANAGEDEISRQNSNIGADLPDGAGPDLVTTNADGSTTIDLPVVNVYQNGATETDITLNINSTDTSVTAAAAASGQGAIVDLNNTAVTFAPGASGSVGGADDTIGLTVNSSSSVTVSGTGDVVTPGQNVVNGTQDAVTFAGDGTTAMVKGSGVAIDLANDDQTVTTGGMSTGDQIAAASGATGDAIDASNATVSAGGAFSGSVSGSDDTVMLVVNTSSSVTISGAGDVIAGRTNVDNGTQNDVTLAGDGTSAMVNGAGVDVTLAADNQTLTLGTAATGDIISAASGVTDDTLAGSNATITAGSGFAGNLEGNNDIAIMASGDYVGVVSGTGETINQSSGQVVMDADTSANIDGANNTISTGTAVAINLDGDGNAATMGAGSYVGVVSGTGETINESSGQVVMLANETANVNGAGDAISAGAGTQINITGSDNTATMANGDYVGVISGQGDVVDLSGGSMRTQDNVTAELNGSNDTTYLGNSVSETVSGSSDTAYLPNNGDSTIDFSGSGFVGSNENHVNLVGGGTDVTVNGESDRIDLTGSNETVDALGGDAIYVGNNVSGMTIYATDSAIYEGSNDNVNIEGSGDGIDGSDSDYTDYDGNYFDDYDGGGGSYGGGSFGGGSSGGSSGGPVVLDVAGKGIKITPLTSSNTYFDMGGDGYEHHTAWAGVGNAVLVLDLAGNGQITQSNQVNFTDWDPTAKTDMQALEDVFDTNHDGKLDVGDADFADFKIMLTNADGTQTLETLAQAGIVSINLTPDKTSQTFGDGSSIDGETTFTKTDGSTGAAATVSFAYGAYAYVVDTTTVHNADGSTTIDNRAFNPDGKLASDTISTTSADGLSKTTSFDSDGDGVIDRIQTDVTQVNADGNRTETLTDKTSASVLLDQTITTTSADGATASIQRDTNGDGITDETEVDSTNPDGSKSVTATDLNLDGSVRSQTITTTSADGLTSTVRTDSNGDGIFDLTKVDATVINADGSSTDTITDTDANGSLHDKTVTTTSADGSSKTVETDSNGDGVFDLTQVSTIVANAGGGTTTTQIDQNADGSKRDETDTTISSDGLSKTTKLDTNGDGVVDLITADVTVLNADGSRTETVTDTNGDGALTSQVVTIKGADGVSRTTEVDSTGNGKFDHTENIAKNASGATVDTVSDFNADGSVKDQFITTTSADGLTQTTQSNLGGPAGGPAESVQEQSFTTNKVDVVEAPEAASSNVTDIQTLPDSAFTSDGPILNTHGNGAAGSDLGLNQLVQAMAGFNAQSATTTSATLPVEAMAAAQSLAVSHQSH